MGNVNVGFQFGKFEEEVADCVNGGDSELRVLSDPVAIRSVVDLDAREMP